MTVEELATKTASVLGVSFTEGTNVFLNEMPSTPDRCVAIHETGGLPPVYVLGQATPAFHQPGAQFMFRGAVGDSETPRGDAKTAFDAFIALQNTDLSSIRYYLFMASHDVFPVGQDNQNRPRYAFNMRFLKDPS